MLDAGCWIIAGIARCGPQFTQIPSPYRTELPQIAQINADRSIATAHRSHG